MTFMARGLVIAAKDLVPFKICETVSIETPAFSATFFINTGMVTLTTGFGLSCCLRRNLACLNGGPKVIFVTIARF